MLFNVPIFAKTRYGMGRCWLRSLMVHLVRMRYSKGFGVQSPSAYAFIRDVVFEELPYYAYRPLSRFVDPVLDEKACQLLFRIVNFASPSSVVDVFPASPAPICYMSSVSRRIRPFVLTAPGWQDDGAFAGVGRQGFDFNVVTDDIVRGLADVCESGSVVVHINRTDEVGLLDELLSVLVTCCGNVGIVVVDGINRQPVKDIWRKACDGKAVSSAFDLYDTGILMFDPNYGKHYYKLNY